MECSADVDVLTFQFGFRSGSEIRRTTQDWLIV